MTLRIWSGSRSQSTGFRLGIVSVLLSAGGLALPSGMVGGQAAPDDCAQPYGPVASASTYPAQEALPPIDAAAVSRPVPRGLPFDSDGDSADDVIDRPDAGGLRITRGDGVLTLTAPGTTHADAYGLGDIDGDGRDEIAVVMVGTPAPDEGTFLVPGTTAAGTRAPSAVGIAFGADGGGLASVADGSGRLLHIRLSDGGAATTDVYDGASVLARGPGGDATSLRPATSVAGQAAAFADLGGVEDAIVTVEDPTGDHAELAVIHAGGVTRLTTEPATYIRNYVDVGTVTVLDGPDGAFVRLDNADRSGAASYLWSLDAPCDARAPTSPPPAAGPTAPPAVPIGTEATFTG